MTRPLKPFFVLAFAELVSFGVLSPRIGFYHDDWTNLERCAKAGGFLGGVGAYAKIVLDRPLEMLQYPLLFAIGGFNPLPYQLIYLALEIVGGFLLYLLLSELVENKTFALLAAVLMLTFPNHSITHIWLGSSALLVSMDLVLASLLLHVRWFQSRRLGLLLSSQALYVAGLLDYEATAFLPLVALAGMRRPGALQGFLPYLFSLAAALSWQRLAVPYLVGSVAARGASLSWSHFFKAYAAGLACITSDVVSICARAAADGGARSFLTAIFFSTAAAFWIFPRKQKPQGNLPWRTILAMAAAAFAAAYLPFALSADYIPMAYGIMSRTSALGAIAGGLLLAAAAMKCLPSRRAPALAAFSLAVFCLANWRSGAQWARSWSLQQDILNKAAARVRNLPAGAVVLVGGFSRFIDDEEGSGALVFDRTWDMSSALRLRSGRPDLAANVLSPRMRFDKNEAVESFQGKVINRYDFKNLFLYGYDRDALFRLEAGRHKPELVRVDRPRPARR